MWHLEAKDSVVKDFKELFYNDIEASIRNSALPQAVKNILLGNSQDGTPVLVHLLTDKPSDLYPLNANLESRINDAMIHFSDAKKKDVWDDIRSLFGYETRISGDREVSYKIARCIGTDTCVYCNRIYTYTIDDNIQDVNGRIVRPDFDHWLPKAENPLVSMSFFNLIPSCPICNRNIKLKKEFKFGTHVHPYDTNGEPHFSFRYQPLKSNEWDVILDSPNPSEKATAELLHTEELYKGHANKEVKDIIDFVHSYTPEYIRDLFEGAIKNARIKVSPEDAYRYLLGTELRSTKDLNRPLSKLKRDILKQACSDIGIDIMEIMNDGK